MNKNFLILAVVAMAIAGCTKGFQQDPYADQPDSVKNATPIESNKPTGEHGSAESRDFLTVQADDNAECFEQKDCTVTIHGTYAVDQIDGHPPVLGQDYVVAIDNMQDFPGASFDTQSGEFHWTPILGYVKENGTRNAHLTASVSTTSGTIQQTQKDILINVGRAEVDPTIVSIEDLSSRANVEGTTRDFSVVVRDPHALDKDNMRPRLQIVSDGTAGATAANLIYCKGGCGAPTADPNDPTLYTFKLTLDLGTYSAPKEITKNQAVLSFGVVATSRFGEPSGIRTSTVKIVSNVNDPVMSWSTADPITVTAGQLNTVNFTLMDPTADSTITVNFSPSCSSILGTDAVCSCAPLSRSGSNLLCTIKWTPPASSVRQDYSVSMTSTNTASTSQGGTKTTSFPSRILRVVQGAAPAPNPGPQPNPGPNPGPQPNPTPTPVPGPIHTSPATHPTHSTHKGGH